MKRLVSFVLVCLLCAWVSAQEGSGDNQPQEQKKGPPTMEEYAAMLRAQVESLKKEQENAPKMLAEAHERLEQTLSPETLAEIDAMKSEGDMIKYHFSLGLSMRNGWGLWKGGALAEHMRELGFIHPDIMSGVILNTFWCKRHGQDLRLEQRAADAKRSRETQRRIRQEQTDRAQEGYAAVRKMMMELHLVQPNVPVVHMQIGHGLNVRSLLPFRDGVLLTVYNQGSRGRASYTEGYEDDRVDGELRLKPEYDEAVNRGFWDDSPEGEVQTTKPGEDFYIQGWYFDPADAKVHWINVPEVNSVYAAVVADDRAWFAGLTNGEPVMVGVSDQDRVTVPLPQTDEIPDLGLDGRFLLAVYSKTVYRLKDRTWELVHSGDILLPRSGRPPLRHGNMVFLCDEDQQEVREGQKHLWWLTMGEKPRLSLLSRDTRLFEPILQHGPDWTEIHGVGPGGWDATSSYSVTSRGDLWTCLAYGSYLLRRSQDGTYSCAIAEKSVEFVEDPSDSKRADQGLSVTGVTALPDDSLLLVGSAGLYRLQGKELMQILGFAPAETPDSRGRVASRLRWSPTNVVALDDGSYLVGTGSWDGLYWLRPGEDGQWTCQYPGRGDPVVW